jgi:phage gpG-like protein
MVTLSADFSGLEGLSRKFENALKRKKDISPLEAGIKEVLVEDVKLRFATAPLTNRGGIAHGNVYWSKMTPNWLATHPERMGKPLLKDTGKLLNSLMVGNDNSVFSINREGFEFGTKVSYAKDHQPPEIGTTIPLSLLQDERVSEMFRSKGKLAPRPFLFIHEALEKEIVDVINEFVLTGDTQIRTKSDVRELKE